MGLRDALYRWRLSHHRLSPGDGSATLRSWWDIEGWHPGHRPGHTSRRRGHSPKCLQQPWPGIGVPAFFQSQEGVDGCLASATHRRGFQSGGSASGHEADCRGGSFDGRRPLRNRWSRFRASRGRVRDWGKLSGSRHRVSHPAASRAHSSRRWRGAFRGGCARGERADACCLSAKRPADAASARRKRPPRDACAATRLIAVVWDENGFSETSIIGLHGIEAEASDQDGFEAYPLVARSGHRPTRLRSAIDPQRTLRRLGLRSERWTE